MNKDRAETGNLSQWLSTVAASLDGFLDFQHPDAMSRAAHWESVLDRELPVDGVGIEQVVAELIDTIIPNASPIPRPGCSSFITTGATSIGAIATLAGAVASPQRIGVHAFSYLETVSLRWLKKLFQLPDVMQGIYSSGGSVANLLALGAARQHAFEKSGIDVAKQGVPRRAVVFASAESHHSVQRACAVLGLGRDALVKIPCDARGRIRIDVLREELRKSDRVVVAVVGNLGTTNAGAIDPLPALVDICKHRDLWLHLDGAYGLPGILDPHVAPLYTGIEHADSVIVDPHKWMGAPVGIAATFVKDGAVLRRAFTQERADYLEGTESAQAIAHSLDSIGIPYGDMGVELSAPARGAVVWALLREIGISGMRERVQRHNHMAKVIAERASAESCLELLREPTLSICCFRYTDPNVDDLDTLNQHIHRRLLHNNINMPSTTMINGKLAIRPCFIGARANIEQAEQLVAEVIAIGRQLARDAG